MTKPGPYDVREEVGICDDSEIQEAIPVRLAPGISASDYVAEVKENLPLSQREVGITLARGLTFPRESIEVWLKVDPGNYILIYWNTRADPAMTPEIEIKE